MREYFAIADEKFIAHSYDDEDHHAETPIRDQPIQIYKFNGKPFSRDYMVKFDRNALPIVFRVSPDSLLNLCIKVIDAFPLPTVYKWTNLQVCTWIRKYGYPHYANTFRVNLITGLKLLLIDAQALSAMNIKNFDDIKHIAYGIRLLFFYEMTKYIRSISLPPEYYYELYKLFRVKSGRKYEEVRRSDLWRRMQLLRKKDPYYSHWELLERWLAREQKETELFGGVRRYRLYKCKPQPPPAEEPLRQIKPCLCMPPCSCYWTEERHLKRPTVFTLLKPNRRPDPCYIKERCKNCASPCTCQWPSHFYKFGIMLTCLKTNFQDKYGVTETEKKRHKGMVRTSFSIFR